MTCTRTLGVDVGAYLVDPEAPEWADFHAHHSSCPECSVEVARWSKLEEVLREATREPDLGHPPEELLLAFHKRAQDLSARESSSVREHLEACPACRDGLTALASFGLSSRREVAGDRRFPTESVARSERKSWTAGILAPLRGLVDAATGRVPAPALIAALLLLVAVPVALVLRTAFDSGEGRTPPLAAVEPRQEGLPERIQEKALPGDPSVEAQEGLLAEVSPTVPVAEPEEAAEAPTEPLVDMPERQPQIASATKPSVQEEPMLRPAMEAGESAASPGDGHQVRTQDPIVPATPGASEIAQGAAGRPIQEDPETMVLALADLGAPLYAAPPGARGPARTHVTIRKGVADLPDLVALVPDHVGQTVEPSPSLFWFASEPLQRDVLLTLIDEESVDPVLEVSLARGAKAGIHQISLSDHEVFLDPGVTYEWFVSLSNDPDGKSHDVVAGGRIRRIEPAPTLQDLLSKRPPEQLGHLYAERGLWYDALAFFSHWIDQDPDEPRLRIQRAALLDQAGLSAVADLDRRLAASTTVD